MTRVLEVEENGTLTLPPDVIGNAKPHTRFVLETHGTSLTLRPTEERAARTKRSRKQHTDPLKSWEEERRKLTEELGKAWPNGVSVVDVISEMRR